MNWARLRYFPWLDKRAHFVAATPLGGALLDLGTSNGETLNHMAELRSDLRFFAGLAVALGLATVLRFFADVFGLVAALRFFAGAFGLTAAFRRFRVVFFLAPRVRLP